MKHRKLLIVMIIIFICFLGTDSVYAKEYLDSLASRDSLIMELEAHENDSKYLGTAYVSASQQGSDTAQPGIGMNCAGFILSVFRNANSNSSFGISGARNNGMWATDWLDYAKDNLIIEGTEALVNDRYSSSTIKGYSSINSLLNQSNLQKGDLIIFVPETYDATTCDYHMGFYWGESFSKQNSFWHSLKGEGNIISEIKGKHNCEYQYVALKFKAYGSIGVEKVSETGEKLSGVTFGLYSDQATTQEVDRKTTDVNGKIIFDKLDLNKVYYVKEISTRPGYKLSESITEITSSYTTSYEKITNEIRSLKIYKKDANTSETLSGAILQLLGSDKKSISCQIKKSDGTIETLSMCEWETTTDPINIVGLSPGTYYISEKKAPDGYKLNKNKTQVDIKSTTGNLVKSIENEKQIVKIHKISSIDGKELPGATLQILDANKKHISCIIEKSDGKLETLNKCEWLTEDKAARIVGLKEGKYYLVETSAPEGYELTTEMVSFEVDSRKDEIEVEMINNYEVIVPDTYSKRKSLFLTLGCIVISLGIFIIIHVKNSIEKLN